MRRNAFVAMMLALLMLFTACSAGKTAESAPAAEAPAAEAYDAGVAYSLANSMTADTAVMEEAMEQEAGQEAGKADPKKIIYTAYMSVTCDDPAQALEHMKQRAEGLGGYLANSNLSNDDLGAYRANITLKVPAHLLDELVADAKALGVLNSYQLDSSDITLNYYDIDARLKSAKAEETQLLEILKSCQNVEEILAVRESLSAVRSDIESFQGQINLWDHLVSYATLELTLRRTERAPVEGEGELLTLWKASDVAKKMGLGFRNSAVFVVNAVGAIGIFLAYVILPAAVFLGIIYLLLRLTKKIRPALKAKREARRARRALKKAGKNTEKKNE